MAGNSDAFIKEKRSGKRHRKKSTRQSVVFIGCKKIRITGYHHPERAKFGRCGPGAGCEDVVIDGISIFNDLVS